MKSQHTPGPWKFEDSDQLKIVIKADRYYTHECIHFADVYEMTGDGANDEAIANAQLIAAAPELLKALESITLSMSAYPDCKEGSEFADMVSIAHKAIAKAKGL